VRLEVRSRSGDYAVEVGAGLLSGIGSTLRGLGLEGRVAVVTDRQVAALWSAPVLESLSEERFAPVPLQIAPGEGSKTLSAADLLWGRLIEEGFGRTDTLLALGGGVVGDLAGFVAATFHRGMRWVQAPTTLLAQVDASIGGKVAIDHRLGKNLVGAFHPPVQVVTDVSTLRTLPERERWNGLAEIVKTALVLDAGLFAELERSLEALGRGAVEDGRWTDLVGRAAGLKAKLVSEDELERGPRMLLNFGHTVGHALESVTGHEPLTHGEAVVLGMRSAVAVSERLGRLRPDAAQRVRALLDRFPQPPSFPHPSRDNIREVIGHDKKARGGQLRYVVLDDIGRGAVDLALPPDLINLAVDAAMGAL
jgi:3-dehydroquinate synthase